LRCDGQGSQESVATDDPLDDSNECTFDMCNNGQASNPPKAQGTDCGTNSVCDGVGNCVGCNTATDCGTNTFCKTRTCVNEICGINKTPDGTPLPSDDQTPGDCQELRCNGQGGHESVAIDDPSNDGKDCTFDMCDNGVPENPPKAIDVGCQNNGSFCDGNGECVECNDVSQCDGADACEVDVCRANACEVEPGPYGTPAPAQFQATGDCRLAVCDGMGAVAAQRDDLDRPEDFNECTDDVCTIGLASNPPTSSGTICNNGVCNGLGSCVECVDDSTCFMGETCDLMSFTCL
jgi:hypothetical protein